MEPGIFAGFASRACRDVAGLVLQAVEDQPSSGATYPAVLRGAQIDDGSADALGSRLAACLTGFAHALRLYAPAHERFRQMLGQQGEAAWDSGSACGGLAGELFGDLFGDLVGALAAAAGGLLGGAAVGRQMQAEGERLQQAFHAMLQAYDEAMAELKRVALDIVASHHGQPRSAARNGRS
jgi:hypothetical protein